MLLSLALACRPPEEPPPRPPVPVLPAPSVDWPHPNLDLAGTRAAKGARICSDNVEELALAWSDPVPVGNGVSTNPIVVDGVVYYQTMKSDLRALDLETGTLLWSRSFDQDTIGPDGVAVADGRLFAAINPLTFAALDASTGSTLWTMDLRVHPAEGIDIQPIVSGDSVYVSTVPMIPTAAHAPGAGGVLYALDVATGEVRWSFDTIDDRTLFWGHPEVNSGGGAWFPPSFEPDGTRMYWGIANPGPFPGGMGFPNATSRPGPNLYTNSLVALDAETGALDWYDQVSPHDLFDYDFHLSPIRVDLEGEALVIGAGKQGRVIAWDAATATRRWEVVVGQHENDTLTELGPGETVTVFPGVYGASETPMAYADGLLFVPVANLGTRYTAVGKTWPTLEEILAATGELVAIDVATGEVAWAVETGSALFSGATVSCDLVFTATFDGTLLAFERETGQERWRWESSVGINSWSAVSGDTLLWPMGVQLEGEQPMLAALRLGG